MRLPTSSSSRRRPGYSFRPSRNWTPAFAGVTVK